jgi:hypothetical protein
MVIAPVHEHPPHPPVSPAEQRIRDDLMIELRELLIGKNLVLVTQVLRCVNKAMREGAEKASAEPRVH